ncbi:MAG: LutB/LldF family L-lactate oxidation iron-sulfur protein [Nitrospinota bacterium]
MAGSASFEERAHRAISNPRLQAALDAVTLSFKEKRRAAFETLPDAEALKDRARQIRDHTFRNLPRHLIELEEKVRANGGHVFWAESAEDACRYAVTLAKARGVRRVVKSKSMASEEIELNHAFEAAGIEALETDFGEWLIQMAGERPSHIIAPAIHRGRREVAELLREKTGEEVAADDVGAMTELARRRLRPEFLRAEMGVTGVNFAVAETGSIVLVTNEGNGRLVSTLPRIHLAIMGIEKVLPTLEDLMLFLRLLPRSATGQKCSAYVSFLTGPRRSGEGDGPEEFHLVIMDNGRSQHLADDFREGFFCIRCGACLNVCPVYREVGGHAYGSVYPGPIGSIFTPMLEGVEEAGELAFASSLCGACEEACPVRLDIPKLLIETRERAQRAGITPLKERLAFRLLGLILRSKPLYVLASRLGRLLLLPFVKEGRIRSLPYPASRWTDFRDLPPIAKRPFRSRWKELVREDG